MERRRQRMVSAYAQPKLGKSSIQKAKDVLRKAAKDGTLREMLWGKDWNNAKKKIAIEAAKQQELSKAAATTAAEDQTTLPPIDDVAIWNRLLAARVMRTVSLLTQQFAIDAAAQLNDEEDDEDEEDYDYDEPDVSDEEKVADEVNDSPRPLSRASSPTSNNKQRQQATGANNNKTRSEHRKEIKHKKDSQHQPEGEDNNKAKPAADDVDFFLNILNNKQSKGPRRVSQIIKEAKDRDNANKRSKGGVLDTMEEESEDGSERSSSAASNTSRGGGGNDESGHVRWSGTSHKQQGNKANKTLPTALKQAGIDFGIASLLHPRGKNNNNTLKSTKKQLLDQQEKKRRMSARQAELASFRSIQVVEGLFAMSNELLMERESILARGNYNTGNNNNQDDKNDAFINRNATLKYNEQLEEVAQSRLDSLSFQRKAALIRLRKSSNKFKSIYHSTNLARFASFWETLQEVNERIDEENLRRNHHRGESAYEGYHAPLEKENDDYSNSNETRAHTRQGTGLPSGMGALESMLEENLGLLFATKTKAGVANSSSRLTTANTRGGGRRGSAGSSHSNRGGKRPQQHGLDDGFDDFNDDEDDGEDEDYDDEGNDRFENEDQIPFSPFGNSNDPLLNNNQHNLSAVIDRMKAMGIYSDDKFRFIYGMTPRSGGANSATPMNNSQSNQGLSGSRLRKGAFNLTSSNNNLNISPSTMERWLEEGDNDGNTNDEEETENNKHQFLKKGSRMKLTSSSSAALYQANNNSRFRIDAKVHDLLLSSNDNDGTAHQQSESETEKQKELFLTQRILSLTATMNETKPDENNDETAPEQGIENETDAPTSKKEKRPPYLYKQSIRPYDEKENRPIVEILGSDRIHVTAVEPTMIYPHPLGGDETKNETASNMHAGRWQYDETLPNLTHPVVIKREEDRFREHDVDIQHQKNLFLHNGFMTFGNKKNKHKTQVLTISNHHDVFQELTFNPVTRQLMLTSYRNNQPFHQQSVDIASVFFTESQVAGMITIRCQPSNEIPSGYLGSFPIEQWLVMEEEMNTAMILLRHHHKQQPAVTWHETHTDDNSFIAIPRYSSLQGQQGGDLNISLPGLTLVHPPTTYPPINTTTTVMKRKGSILTSEDDDHFLDADDDIYDPHSYNQFLPSWDDIMRQAAITAKYAQRPSSAPDIQDSDEIEEKKKQQAQIMLQEYPEIAVMNDHRPLHGMTIQAKTASSNPRGSTSQLPPSFAPSISLSQSLKVQSLAVPPKQPKSSAASFRTKRMLATMMAEEEASTAAAAAATLAQQQQSTEGAIEEKPFDFRSLRISIPTKPEPPTDNEQQQPEEEIQQHGEMINLENLPFNFNFQIVQLIESRRIMQLYFTKKFLQLDLPVNVHMTIYDAAESILEAPGLYGIIFVSYMDLIRNGSKPADLQKALQELLPVELDKMRFSIFVYDVNISAKDSKEEDDDNEKDSRDGFKDSSSSSSSDDDSNKDDDDGDEILATLEYCGVTDVIHPPYDITTLKNALATHQRKQEFRMQFAAAAAFKFPR